MGAVFAESPTGLAALRPLIDAATAHAGLLASEAAKASPDAVLLRTDARPASVILVQEGRAAALWTGRLYHARGGTFDTRATDARISIASVEGTPDGWAREETKLIHKESGLECPASFNLPGEKGVRVLGLGAVSAYDQRGRDVSCNYGIDGDATVTVYASYYPTVTLEDHAAQAVNAIRQNFTIRGELPVTIVTVEPKDGRETGTLPEALSGAFDVGEINGVPYKTAIWLAETHGWHVKTRATYAQADFMSELTAAILFGVNYVNVDMKNRIEPTKSGPEV